MRATAETGGIFMRPTRRCRKCGRLLWSEKALKTGYGCVCERKANRAERKPNEGTQEEAEGQMSFEDLFKTDSIR